MNENNKYKDQLVFGLDIGTRSIVGSVGYLERDKFNVIAHCVKEHDTRAMIDGQIHDIQAVGNSIDFVKRELENQLGSPLKDVCIAAAGRVLKTVTVHVEWDLEEDMVITNENIYSLDLMGVEKAYEEIRESERSNDYFCVGYSVIKYYMNGFFINNLEGHKGKHLAADVLATFLPNEVVDGLYSAVSVADLEVASLTLEPIAAINIAIPEQFRLLNIALVDVGAGTSDISITKDGSIIAYGMIPHAGDEITEALVHKYLVDFKTAEKIKISACRNKPCTFKDIMALSHKLDIAEAKAVIEATVRKITKEIADKIVELNGGKSVNAVFIVGGGGKAFDFTTSLSEYLDIPDERVALRGEEVLGDVEFVQPGIKKDPLLVTPIGICLNYYSQKNNFIFVNINGQRIKLYDNSRLTVVDAALQIAFPNEELFPRRGHQIDYSVNGIKRMAKGELGEPAIITINGEEANINSAIVRNDHIIITPSTIGEDASLRLEELPEFHDEFSIFVDNKKVVCPKFFDVSGHLENSYYEVKQDDDITVLDYYTIEQLLEMLDIDDENFEVFVNNEKTDSETKVYANFKVSLKPKTSFSQSKVDELQHEELGDEIGEDMLQDSSIEDDYIQDDIAEDDNIEVDMKKDNNISGVNDINDISDVNDIYIIVNREPICLKNKKSYIFVDILDFYPFDTQTPSGNEIVMTLNGENASFTDSIKDGDITELYWK